MNASAREVDSYTILPLPVRAPERRGEERRVLGAGRARRRHIRTEEPMLVSASLARSVLLGFRETANARVM